MNVINTPYDCDAIFEAIRKSVQDKAFRQECAACTNPYGDGNTAARVARILREIDLEDENLIRKRITLDPTPEELAMEPRLED